MAVEDINSSSEKDSSDKQESDSSGKQVTKNDQLKKLPVLLGSSKLSNRKEGFHVLENILEAKEFSESFAKGISLLLVSLIPTYNDRTSQHFLTNSFKTIILKFGSLCKSHLINFYATQAQGHSKIINSTLSLGRYHSYHFEVGCKIWSFLSKSGFQVEEKESHTLVDALSIYFSLAVVPSAKKLLKRLINNIKLILDNPKDRDLLCEALTDEEGPTHKMIFGGWVLQYLSQSNLAPPPKIKPAIINIYVKNVLHTKKKPCLFILEKSSALLKQITEEEFVEFLLPVSQKSLLRNPEIILETVGYMFSQVTLDLSKFMKDYLKVIENPLHANEDKIREDAVFVCEWLAKQCSEFNAIRDFIKIIFDIFNGSYGKLTVNSHKISLLQALEKVSHHRVPKESSYQLSEEVTLKLLKVLETETHEASLVQALSTLSSWATKFEDNIPDKLLEFVPKGLNLKTSTTNVKASYYRLLLVCVSTATSSKFQKLISCFTQMLEKALAQPSQVTSVTEALSICCLLLKLSESNSNLEEKVDPVWASALDPKKNYFGSEKFLMQASAEALLQLVSFSESLLKLNDNRNKFGSDLSHIRFSLIWCLVCSHSNVRRSAQASVRSLCLANNGYAVASDLVTVTEDVISSLKEPVKDKDENSDSGGELSPIGVIQGLIVICSTSGFSALQKEDLILQCVKIIFHPLIVAERKDLWEVICRTLNLQPAKIIESHQDFFSDLIMTDDLTNTKTTMHLISGICSYGGSVLYPKIVPYIVKCLDEPALNEVTEEEIAIYTTPEGVLYNQTAVEQAFQNELNVKNVKKTTKAYSHKEQMMMLEEKKKEMEKRRKEGKLDLTPKQREVMKIELEKEAVVRKKIKDLNDKVSMSIVMLEASIEGNIYDLASHLKILIPIIIKYLPSRLIGSQLGNIFYKLQKSVFSAEEVLFGAALARTTLRLYKCCMDFPLDWTGEYIEDSSYRVLENLHEMTSSTSENEEKYLTASGFVYCFPLLEWVVERWIGESSKKDRIVLWVINIIKTHMVMRGRTYDSLYHPRFLPREQLLKLLINIISTREGRLQQRACAVLQDVSLCASGLPGCDRASQEEISILLNTLTAPAQSVRDASLRGLNVLIDSLQNLSLNEESWSMMTHRLWVAKHDEDEDIRSIASDLWDKAGMKSDENLLEKILGDVTHATEAVRYSAAVALASLIKHEEFNIEKVVQKLIQIYKKKLEMTPAKKDQYDHIIEEAIDHWEGRAGVGLALYHIAPLLQEKSVVALAKFFVPESLGDRDENVRRTMLNAAMAVVNHHGKETVNSLLPVFEKFLNTAPNHAKFDAVQESAANCLHPLVPAIKDDCPKIVSKLMNILLESSNYGQRKGAAYGLASVVKGLGILSLKQLDIMNQLTVSIQDKKVYRYREGALFAIEQLCNMLGKLFEPYIVHILPHLLLCFGDGNTYVRQAADDTAKAVMSKLSAHGVKLVLPSLLAALEEDSWRTKTGSVELLGNMAFCAPKQLSSCLPSIVPRLIEVLSDSHQKVQTAGAEALKLIGSVIRNPEIQAIVPVLLDALQEPGPNTSTCLQTLLETKFVHFIDAPSLALIMPVVQRAFQDRSTEVRKMAAQIIGNMYSLTDQKDLAPYLPSIIPGLKASLLDPVPKVRSVSARALGAMVKGMGESSFDDLLPWLMQTLTSEASPVDRSGAAQGLAEVVGGLGPEKLHRLMPDIVATAERSDIAPHVKDGYIMMFIFLPTVFEEEFTPYIGQIIPPILKALADENEFVRDTALRAGQRIVNTYAASAVTLLLPELENGLFHDNWRIRYSSVQLLGDLLYRVSGVSGKMTTDTAHEDDNFGTEHSQKAIMNVLGEERRNRVLAGLYMGRSDVALMVRQAALHVWKVVVTNTPKTLREILPTLFSLLLSCLASTSYDKRQVAARTLGDLVRKLGERVLPEIIPILEAGLSSPESDHRQGVCIGLSEIMASTSKDMVMCFSNNLVPTVRRALCDPLPAVREAAAHTFDSLHSTVGTRALDDILPRMLEQLQDETSDQREYALDGLKQVMTIKSRVVLPYLIPQLTTTPVNTQALCILSSVAGDTLTRHLNKILPALLAALSETQDSNAYDTALGHCQEVILAVNDDMGVNTIVDEFLTYSKSKNTETSRAAVSLLYAFCSNTRADYSDYAPQLIRGLIQLLVSSDQVTLQTAWEALNAVTKSLDSADQRALVSDVRQAVKFTASDLKGQSLIPGFCLPKGIQPILPIFREAILNGEPEHKEAAANGLTEVIRLTSSDALKTSVVHITGPLIRILGDRFTWNVKVAVLDTLALLLEKAGPMLKPFLPQLQTTFVKSVHDPNRVVRLKAGHALSHLISIHTKPDPLFTELHNSVKTSDDPAVRETMLQAVRAVVGPAGFRISDTVCKGLVNTLSSLLQHDLDSIRLCAAGALGTLIQWLNTPESQNVVSQYVLGDEKSNADYRILHGKSSALFCTLKSSSEQLFKVASEEKVTNALLNYMASDKLSLVENGVVGVGFLLKYQILNDLKTNHSLVIAFGKMVNHLNNEVKQAMCRSCQYIAEKLAEKKGNDVCLPSEVARPLLPMLVNGTKEKNPIVRSSAEMALIAILKLKNENTAVQTMLNVLDGGAKDALSDAITKIRASYSPVTESEMDPSILT
ncbi:eIF-2-alpha kinase activator GCN1 [Armadillidium nasatum]|uniref:eIF-2-alpha kinase activator GCN1 n=1 Tax=Armadillidium nasatum TaxID=96803 RepID=A0A5N5TD71_9CRUS|nr:eIF-2-alpha kinase activator GCN1 [Armadillidium nasatum]